MFCVNCGMELADNANFCMNCGCQITGNNYQYNNYQYYNYGQPFGQNNYSNQNMMNQTYENYQQNMNNQYSYASNQQYVAAQSNDMPLKKEVFYSNSLFGDEKIINKVNDWLKDKRIKIKNISLTTSARVVLVVMETVLTRLEIEYYEMNDNNVTYQMGYVTSMGWIEVNYKKVDKKLEKWKTKNPQKKVVWSRHCGHQIQGGSSQTLYFLYV